MSILFLIHGCLEGLLCLWLVVTPPAIAQDVPLALQDPSKAAGQQNTRHQALADDATAQERERQELRTLSTDLPGKLQALQSGQVTEAMVEQAQLDTRAVQLRQDELQGSIANAEGQIKQLEQSIKALETQEQLLKNPAKNLAEGEANRGEQLERTHLALTQQQTNLELEKQHLANLHEHLALTGQRLALTQQWQSQVEALYRFQQEQNRQEVQQDVVERLQKPLQRYKDQATKFRQRLQQEQETLTEAQRHKLEVELQNAEEQTRLTQLDIRLSAINTMLAPLEAVRDDAKAIPEKLKTDLEQLDSLQKELQTQLDLLQRKVELVQQQQRVSEQRETQPAADRRLQDEEVKLLAQLATALSDHQKQVQQQLSRVETAQENLAGYYKQVLSKDLLTRQTLPATAAEWQTRLNAIADAFEVLLHQVQLSLASTLESMEKKTDLLRWMGFSAAGLSLVALLLAVRRGLMRTVSRLDSQEDRGFSSQVALLAAELLQKNLAGLGVASALLIIVWFFQVPQPGRGILMTLAGLGIGLKVLINLVWSLLASPRLPVEQRSLKLYRQWVGILSFGGILAAITILAHLSALDATSVSTFDWMLMLYLLLFTVSVLRVRRHIIAWLASAYSGRSWFVSLRLLNLFLPLSLLGAAIVGLVGYLNLAWAVAWYLVVFILLLAGWLIVLGLLGDLIAALKNYAATHSSYGLLWTQEIITPFHRLLRILLTLAACIGLLRIYGWEAGYLFPTVTWYPLLLAGGAALLAYQAVYILASYLVEQTQSPFGGALIRHSRRPMELLFPVAGVYLVLSTLALSEDTLDLVRHTLVLVQIGAVTWLLVGLVSAAEELIGQRYRLDNKENLSARRVVTQVRILQRITLVAVYVIAIAAILITFPRIWQLGAGLLASAGVAGLVIGVAARPLLENLIAGVQLSLTQPIRIADWVIVEGEAGQIAEINATHVVVRLWDDRRLVVPLNYFNTNPFQNWTRTSTELLGTAFFYVDYTFPVEAGRQALKQILAGAALWDGRAWGLQVTNATEHTVELRALMSASDASRAWDLRCHVREKFIEFLQQNYPDCLPRTRAVLQQENKRVVF
jgi:potassium efflux system protein